MESQDLVNEKIRFFKEFLVDEYTRYNEKITKMLQSNQQRLIVNLNDVRNYSPDYAWGYTFLTRLLNNPTEFIPPFEIALKQVVDQTQQNDKGFFIGLEGSFGENKVSPRNLNSSYLGKLISLEAIVTRCIIFSYLGSLVRPKVAKSVHFCEKTQLFSAREYRDGLSLADNVPTPSVYPKEVLLY
jgi:DNA replication licensing factor MCM3